MKLKENKTKLIICIVTLGVVAILVVGSIVGRNDINPDNGKIDIVIFGDEKIIQIPDIGGAIGEVIGNIIPTGSNSVDNEQQVVDEFLPGYEIEPLAEVNPRTSEEIAKTGVTAQDVLDLLDLIALKLYQYPIYNDRADYGENWEKLRGQFIGMNTSVYYVLGDDGNYHDSHYPFYAYSKEFVINHRWFDEGEILERKVHKLKNVYYVTFDYRIGLDNRAIDFDNPNMGVSYEDFCALMEVFEVKKFTLTKELKEGYENHKFFNSKFTGQEVYEPFEITREVIENANQEQLDVLYAVINNSITSINFEGKLPESTDDVVIE